MCTLNISRLLEVCLQKGHMNVSSGETFGIPSVSPLELSILGWILVS